MPNQNAVLTSSTVRQWIASLKVEEFLLGKAKPASTTKSRSRHSVADESLPSEAPSLYNSSTGEDYEEFLKMMQHGIRPFRKPGISIKEEYELWLGSRAKSRTAKTPDNQAA